MKVICLFVAFQLVSGKSNGGGLLIAKPSVKLTSSELRAFDHAAWAPGWDRLSGTH
jgi:hypothetical protein